MKQLVDVFKFHGMICLHVSKVVKLIQRLIFGIPCVLTTKFDVLNRNGLSVPFNGIEALPDIFLHFEPLFKVRISQWLPVVSLHLKYAKSCSSRLLLKEIDLQVSYISRIFYVFQFRVDIVTLVVFIPSFLLFILLVFDRFFDDHVTSYQYKSVHWWIGAELCSG